MTRGSARRRARRHGRDRIAELRAEEGWSSWTAARFRRLSPPTDYTWSGMRDIMGAAGWVVAWVFGIAFAVGLLIFVGVALFRLFGE
jgi:hypothetical protein